MSLKLQSFSITLHSTTVLLQLQQFGQSLPIETKLRLHCTDNSFLGTQVVLVLVHLQPSCCIAFKMQSTCS
ncbi:hypothetical protein SORBI_3004G136333 [Sorghum bicolor]|uniref:Uncharacterized protein n=1 Tax=Sorghum bicolor TaxID=4558 RepID=A0A1Z5RMH8_SORBI|nr:hypothetical protein SORBI_3004G136333 [Sorghum bicolor]